jgi:small-conductance mechanosensitive channel
VTKAAYTLYGAWQVEKSYKRDIVGTYLIGKDPDKPWGKAEIYDKFATILLVLMTTITITDTFGIQLGASIKSLVAVAGLGTTVLAFAAQDIAGNLIAGLALATSDKFQEGDVIEVKMGGDQISGVVDDIGWLETAVRGPDEVVVKLPNSVFPKAQLSNKSRINNSRVVQTLSFSYDDMDKIPRLVEDIKQRLIENCSPELISDGSRPFVVTWTGFQEEYLEVLVDARFNVAPMTEEYHVINQRVMETIAKATRENDVFFKSAARQETTSSILKDVTEITVTSVDREANRDGKRLATPS